MTLQEIIAKEIYGHELLFSQNGTADGMKTAENIIQALQEHGAMLHWACDYCPGFECSDCQFYRMADIVQAYHESKER